eukprot:5573924-Ditylum_brightwellii.AAC.1
MPKFSPEDAVTHAALKLIAAIKDPLPSVPFLNFGLAQREAIKQLADIFNSGFKKKEPELPTHAFPPKPISVQSPPEQTVPAPQSAQESSRP